MRNQIYNFVTWLFGLKRSTKGMLLLAIDILIVATAVPLAFLIRLESIHFLFEKTTYQVCGITIFSTILIFQLRGLYSAFTRYFSLNNFVTITAGTVFTAAILIACVYFFGLQIPRSVPLISAVLTIISLAGFRRTVGYISQNLNRGQKLNIAIYGAGTAGAQLMSALKWNPGYQVCHFIDDDPKLTGQTIAGVPINSFDETKKKFKQLKIDTLLLAVPITFGDARSKILNLLSEHSFKVKFIPSLSSLIRGAPNITEMQDLNIEDLLGREPVEPEIALMTKTITGKSVLVTGAAGSIGSELCRQIIQWAPKELILLDMSEFAIYKLSQELDSLHSTLKIDILPIIGLVQDPQCLRRIFDIFDVDTVYHAAAYKHVPLMEQNVVQCITNNVFGTLNLAEYASKAGVNHFILISTDKAVNPTNFMGASKRLSELICKSITANQLTTKFAIVRFGNVLGSSGSVVPLFKKQIEMGGPVSLTNKDATRFFMTIPEAAQLVIQAGSIASGGEVFVLDMGKSIRILDLAKKMITLSGNKPVLDTQPTNRNEISINTVGLRPGEKLHEELSYNADLKPTLHPRIWATSEESISFSELELLLTDLRESVAENKEQKIFQALKTLIPDLPNFSTSTDIFISRASETKSNVSAYPETKSLKSLN